MKARFFAIAALVLGLASCQKDFAPDATQGGEVNYRLSISAPELAKTRAALDGQSEFGAVDYYTATDWSKADLRYILEVWDADEDGNAIGDTPVKDRQAVVLSEYASTSFEVRLVQNRNYRFVVFADFVEDGAAANWTDTQKLTAAGLNHQIGATLKDIKVINEEINNESADAYFKGQHVRPTHQSTNEDAIVLQRPYAKVRVVATDLHELNLNVEPKAVKVSYYAANPNAFDAVTGKISVTHTQVDFSRTYAKSDKYGAGYDAMTTTTVNGDVRNTHKTLFTDYILAVDEQTTISFDMTVYEDEAYNNPIKTTKFNTEIPIQRNHLTTIIGDVLTTGMNVDITIDDDFANGTEWNPAEDEFDIEVWDGKSSQEPAYDDATNTYTIYEASELAWLADQVNGVTRAAGRDFAGETFKLAKDVDLGLNKWTPIGATGKFLGTFDGQDHTVYNLVVSEADKTSVGLFANGRVIKNIKVVNAEISGHYKAGVIVGDGLCAQIENCHVEKAKVVVTPINNDDANNVGGIVGYLSAEPTAYVKNCSVKNAEITAYRKVAGIVGAANGASEVSGNIVENVTVTADQTAEYKEFKATEAGAIVGYKHANVKFENNTEGEKVVVIRKVNSNEELKAAMGVVNEGDIVEVSAGTYSKFVAPAAKITVKCENGTKFIGRNKLNILGSTVEGATFTCDWQNGDYVAVDQTINGIFKNCLFVSWDALRYCYAGETCVFEDCYFKGGQYGVHFDGGANDITFRRCYLSGFNAFGGKVTELTFDECTFYYATDGMWDTEYNGVNLWGKTNLNNTTFVFDGQAKTEWIGLNGATEAGNEIALTGCKVVDGEGNELPLFQYFANYDEGDKVTIDGEVYTLGDEGSIEDANGNLIAYSKESLQYLLDNAVGGNIIIRFDEDIEGDVTVDQVEGKNYVIDGNGHKFDGTIYIDGNARNGGAETVLIQNINFETAKDGINFIEQNSTDGAVRYPHNVTIKNCTFKTTGDTVVGIRFKQGYNIVIEDCVAAASGLHSLGQLPGCTGVTINNVNVEALEGGFNLTTTKNITIKNSTIVANDYAVRVDANHADDRNILKIENVDFTAKYPVVARYFKENYTINFEGNNKLTAPGYQVVLTLNKDNETLVAPTGEYTLTGAENFVVFPSNVFYAYNKADLQSLLDNAVDGNIIRLAADIEGDVTVSQKADVKITIDGNNHNFAGVIVVDGKSATYTTAGVTIKNINFKADAISADAVIRLGNGTNPTRYTCNVTVEGCTFDVPGAVAVKSYTGGDKNLKISNCTVTANAHSLVQAKGIDGILVEKCTVNSKNGLNFNNSENVTVDQCTVDVKGYAVRYGEGGSSAAGRAETYNISNSTLKSACDDGDAVIILRGSADNATLNITKTTLDGAIQITNNAVGAKVIIDGVEI